ncbi:MAG TPA: GNAT family N-acetyltransferase [Pseudonocardiaceae bacterium]|nr:GNAT family N-acetyltransferase [Pseudonocardiaceae bacterium]
MTVTDNKELSRYELRDGDQLVGFAEYHFHRGEMAILHTEIKPEFGGHGFGGQLAKAMLDDARARGLKVLPYCPFTRAWIVKHPDYQDLVPDTHKSMLEQ